MNLALAAAALILSIATLVFAVGGAWALVQFKIKKLETDNETFQAAIESLKDTIREEFDKAINRINTLLFEEGGMPRYVTRAECSQRATACRNYLNKNVEGGPG